MNSTEDMRRNDSEDLGWISKVKQGNRHLFEKLVLKYQKRIYYTVRKIVLDHDDTNDIVQETFIKVYMHLDRFDEALPFYPWLQKIAVNTALNHISHVKRRREVPVETSGGLPREASSEEADPMDHVVQNELREELEKAMSTLPAEQRAVFILRTSEGLSYAEIAEQLSLSRGTVMSRLSRAREKLRVLLKPYLAGRNTGSKNYEMR